MVLEPFCVKLNEPSTEISLLPTNGMPALPFTVTLTPCVAVQLWVLVMVFCPLTVVLCCTLVLLVW